MGLRKGLEPWGCGALACAQGLQEGWANKEHCPYPLSLPAWVLQKAEQEVEQWKKEAAAQEAGADLQGKEETPAPKVSSCPWEQACSGPSVVSLL